MPTDPCRPTDAEGLDAWRHLAPLLPAAGLEALHAALESGDQRVCQRPVCRPESDLAGPPAQCQPVAYALWRGLGLETAGEVYSAFDEMAGSDELIRQRMATVYYWYGFGAPQMVRRQLADEVWRQLQQLAPAPPKGRRRKAAT